jgi:hypothetical protein
VARAKRKKILPFCFSVIFFQVLLQSTQDSSQSVTTSYRYISAPVVVAARFDSTGTGLSITFDQGTDRAGVATSQIDCGFVIQV